MESSTSKGALRYEPSTSSRCTNDSTVVAGVANPLMVSLSLLLLGVSATAQDPAPPAVRDIPFGQWVRVDGGRPEAHGDPAPTAEEIARRLGAAEISIGPLPGFPTDLHVDADGTAWVATDRGLVLRAPGRKPVTLRGEHGLPIEDLRALAVDAEAAWAATPHGVVRFDGERWRRFAGRRWLPSDDARDLVLDAGGTAWVRTAAGDVGLARRRMTLADKADAFQRVLEERHLRHGLVAGLALREPGVLDGGRVGDSDNDGLWTGMYLAAQCFRFAVTRDEAARAAARSAFDAMHLLATVTGRKGFPARTVVTPAEGHGGGEWHPSADGRWIWKGDTSSDEIVGHMFAYGLYYDLVAEGEEKARVRTLVDDIMGHIVEHDFNLTDIDGKPTRWGRWGPDYAFSIEGFLAAGLQALEILSHLQVAIHVTGDERYRKAYDRLVRQYGYARMTLRQKINVPTKVNHSDDELAFLSYYPLLRYETDPELRRIYVRSLTSAWKIERPEQSPLWNFICGSARGAKGDPDPEASLEWLRDVPLDLVGWDVDHSPRRDVRVSPFKNRHENAVLTRVLPVSERRLMRWNSDPYTVKGGDGGRAEDEPTFWLLPYWMGRYHGFVTGPEKE